MVYSLWEINQLPSKDKINIYKTLLPEWLFKEYGVDNLDEAHKPSITFRYPKGGRTLEIIVKCQINDIDPLLYLNMADAFNNQLLVLLAIVNDPNSPRFNTDIDPSGNPTYFGTVIRNKEEEIKAMNFGLAPGQVKKGLRVFKEFIPMFENFITELGHDIFFIEPLAYHNAISFERYGFNYLRGHQEMIAINESFQPGEALYNKLSPDNPFRHPDAWKTVRGRSWAIHDGILGKPFSDFQMYKRIGIDAKVNTFPDALW